MNTNKKQSVNAGYLQGVIKMNASFTQTVCLVSSANWVASNTN
jgi:hypothetical protein